MSDRLAYKPQEVADLTGFSKETIMRAIHKGDLRAKKHGNRYTIKRAEVEAWLDEMQDAV